MTHSINRKSFVCVDHLIDMDYAERNGDVGAPDRRPVHKQEATERTECGKTMVWNCKRGQRGMQ